MILIPELQNDLTAERKKPFDRFSGSWLGGKKTSVVWREASGEAPLLPAKGEITRDTEVAFAPMLALPTQSAPSSDAAATLQVAAATMEAPDSSSANTTNSVLHSSDVVEDDPVVEPSISDGKEERVEDYTKLPAMLDDAFDRMDADRAVRPTIIKPGDQWQRARQKTLLLSNGKPMTVEQLSSADLNKERTVVFDLLDALTRSGAIPYEDAAVHIVLGATHSFDDTLMNTVVQRNMNPIESLERSSLIMASPIFGTVPVETLVQPSQVDRLRETAGAFMDD